MKNIFDKKYPEQREITPEVKSKPLLEIMTTKYPDTEWLVQNLIPSSAITAISGSPASYKTWIILDLAIRVALGDILFDKFPTFKTGVLLIDEENGEPLLQKRLQKMSLSSFVLPIEISSLQGMKLSTELVTKYIQFCLDKDIKLIIFDSLVRIHSSDENDAMSMSNVFSLLKEFTKQDITVIFTHHNRKPGINRQNLSQEMRGSSDILASVDAHIAITRKENFIELKQTKLRQGEELEPFNLEVIKEDNNISFEYEGEIDNSQSKKSDMKDAIKDLLQDREYLYKKEIYDLIKSQGIEGEYSTFKTAIQELVEEEDIFEQKGEKNKMFCSIKPFSPNQNT